MKIKEVFTVLFLLMGGMSVFAQEGRSYMRIGLIADIQYADKGDGKTRFYRNSIDKLTEAVDMLNKESVEMSVVLGDLVDEGPKDLVPILNGLEKLDSPFFNLLGNHDYGKPLTANIFETFKMPAPYYSIEKGQWRFLFLNTNELSSYAVFPGSKEEEEYSALIAVSKSDARKNAQPWNGGIGKIQLEWLVDEVNRAGDKNQKVLVFTHHPLFPESGYEALNNREILEVLVKNKHVKGVLSGHHHAGGFALFEDLPCVTLEGMIETEKQSAFGVLDIYNDRLEITGEGRLSSRYIKFR